MKKLVFYLPLLLLVACHKNDAPPNPVTPPVDTTTKPPTDPGVANTMGFFLDDWAPKNFTVPTYEDVTKAAETATTLVTVDASSVITKIPKSITGQNSNLWMSQIVTEVPLMNHLTNLHPNVI